ncbi:MAG: hypothetical protein ACFFD8_07535 [Candidatus Thorarchaeota archaeon]
MQDTVCCGCSVVCDDVSVALTKTKLHSLGLCQLGHAYCESVLSKKRLLQPLIRSETGKQMKSTLREALDRSAELLHQWKNPLFLGWSNSTNETIQVGLKLTKQVKGVFDSTASFEYGSLLDHGLYGGEKEKFSLDNIRDSVDHVVYWGVNPAESHHRHASRYTVFPKGKNVPEGRESRVVSVLDIRESESMRLANHQLILSANGGDSEFLQVLVSEIEGTRERVPKTIAGVPAIEFLSFAKQLREANNVAIFYGNGLISNTHANESLPLIAQVAELLSQNQQRCFSLPMVAYCNTVGAVKVSYAITKLPFSIDFTSKPPKVFGDVFQGVLQDSFDGIVTVGYDALGFLPGPIAKAIKQIPIIALSTQPTLTTRAATVVFPTALTGVETGGSVHRMDGTPVTLLPFRKPKLPVDSELNILTQLLARMK